MGMDGVISERDVHSPHWRDLERQRFCLPTCRKNSIYTVVRDKESASLSHCTWLEGEKAESSTGMMLLQRVLGRAKQLLGALPHAEIPNTNCSCFGTIVYSEKKPAIPFPQNKVIKMQSRWQRDKPILVLFITAFQGLYELLWFRVSAFMRQSCFSCYCCILQTTERKAPGISKAVDSAETPQFNLWSETADRLQTPFYFTVTKAMNLVLCCLNQWWLMSFKTFKSAKGSSLERKGFTWHRKETRPCCMVTRVRYSPALK